MGLKRTSIFLIVILLSILMATAQAEYIVQPTPVPDIIIYDVNGNIIDPNDNDKIIGHVNDIIIDSYDDYQTPVPEIDNDQSMYIHIDTEPAEFDNKPLTGVKIGLDPGHQRNANTQKEPIAPDKTQTKYKVTGGATGTTTGIPEYETVLDIAFKLRDKLENYGATVYMTRETHDVNISNIERAQMMNNYEVDLMLRIHCDSATNASRNGVALYTSKTYDINQESYYIAKILLPHIIETTNAKDNGITVNDDYTGQNWADVPCIMIECGYISNPTEDRLLNTDEYQDKITDGILNGIIEYFGQDPEENHDFPTPKPTIPINENDIYG